MKDGVTHRLSAEGADPLLLTGVNDANLSALERATGVRATMRGDQVLLAGDLEAVERAARVASTEMVDNQGRHRRLLSLPEKLRGCGRTVGDAQPLRRRI